MTEPVPFDPGPRPELAWLPLAMLSIDQSYQRTIDGRISQKSIGQIADNFRWSCFGVVMVAAKGDGWVIIDGQHRVEAARRCKLATVPCIIVPAGTAQEQAKIFLATNETRVRVNVYALHHARLAAGDEDARAIDDLARKAGIDIPRWPIPRSHIKAGQTLAIQTIKRAASDRHGTKAVLLVGQHWRTKPNGIPATVINGAWNALIEEVPEAGVIRWLERHVDVTSLNVADITAAMRRAANYVPPRVADGTDPRRLMGAR